MNDKKLHKQHFQYPINNKKYPHQSNKQSVQNPRKDLNLFTENLNLNINYDYDLPFKELQYTKTRKYKQNLNPLFQQLQTTHQRYTHQHPNRDRSGNSDKSQIKEDFKPSKMQNPQFKQRPRILSDSFQDTQKIPIFSFGQLSYTTGNKISKGKINQTITTLKNTDVSHEHRIKKPAFDDRKFQSYFDYKSKNPIGEQLTGEPTKVSQEVESIDSEQKAEIFLQQTANRANQIQTEIKQSSGKLQLLKKQVQMHKQKNILKQRQIYFLDQQKLRIQKAKVHLQKSLKQNSGKYSKIQIKHHETHKKLRLKKQEWKKQQNWLKEENTEIKSIEGKFQKLLKMLRDLQQEEQRRQEFWKQMQEESQRNSQLKMYLQQVEEKFISLTEEIRLIQQQTQTLGMHEKQLLNLESKFKKQTEVLIQSFEELEDEIDHKKQFISQEKEIDDMIQQLQLEIGQINQRKITVDQQIQDIHVKISLKKRNIKYIQNNQPERRELLEALSDKVQQKEPPTYQVSKFQIQNKRKSLNPLIPLPTIRQQSKNTSAYQSPKKSVGQRSQERSYHPFQSNALQVDSRRVLKTQILKPHQQESEKKLKKYFVIDSEEDAMSNPKSSFCFKERKSEQIFIEKQKKPSIEQIMFRNEDIRLKTDTQDKKSYSIELSSQQMNEFEIDRVRESLKIAKFQESTKKQQSKQHRIKDISEKQSPQQSEEVFQSLISRYEHIKSNSHFDESWKKRI